MVSDTVNMQATTGRERSRQPRAICHADSGSGCKSRAARRGAGLLALLALALVLTLLSARPALAAGFKDAASVANSPYYVQIQTLAQLGVICGYEDGSFRPLDPVTRQQFAKMVVLAMRVAVSESDVCTFADVESDPNSLFPDNYVAAAAREGITTGTRAASGSTPALFSPDANIPLAQLVTMATRASGRPLAAPPSSFRSTWGNFDPVHAPQARLAQYNMLLREFDLAAMDPWRNATRAEAAAILFNLLGTDGDSITGYFLGTTGDLVTYFRSKVKVGEEKFTVSVEELARLYDKYAREFGIRADVAWVQMCHETGFGRYGGDVDPSQNNFAGIGATGGVPGNSFASAELGVIAQIAHLAWYAYPDHFDHPYCRMVTSDSSGIVTEPGDPRHFLGEDGSPHRGNVRILEDLSGKWATGSGYGAALKKMVVEVPLTKGF